jgi:hypothetical protein
VCRQIGHLEGGGPRARRAGRGGALPTFNDLALGMFRQSWSQNDAAYLLANLTGRNLSFAIPSTLGPEGEPQNYCLFCYPDYPDGTFRASPTSYSYLLRTFMNFGTAPPGSLSPMVLRRDTAAMMRNVSEGAASAPGQGHNPQVRWLPHPPLSCFDASPPAFHLSLPTKYLLSAYNI